MKTLLPLAALLASPALAADTVPIAGTKLDVSAGATVTHAPDMATISTGVVTQARTASAAMGDNAQRMTATIAALKKAGIADRDIQTSSITLGPQYRYADDQPPVLTGYQAGNRVTVRLRDLTRVGPVLDALVAAGANQIDGPTFGIDHPEPLLDQARTQALATARARAELYAKAAGLHVARIVSITDGYNEPPAVFAPAPMLRMSAKAPTPIESGEQSLTVTLSVTFELN